MDPLDHLRPKESSAAGQHQPQSEGSSDLKMDYSTSLRPYFSLPLTIPLELNFSLLLLLLFLFKTPGLFNRLKSYISGKNALKKCSFFLEPHIANQLKLFKTQNLAKLGFSKPPVFYITILSK